MAGPTGQFVREAERKLARIGHPHEIHAMRAGDEDLICSECIAPIESWPKGYRHDPLYIDFLRNIAEGRSI